MRLALALAFLLVAVSAAAAEDCAVVDDTYTRVSEVLRVAAQNGQNLNSPLDAYMKASDEFFRCHQRRSVWLLAVPLPKAVAAQPKPPR